LLLFVFNCWARGWPWDVEVHNKIMEDSSIVAASFFMIYFLHAPLVVDVDGEGGGSSGGGGGGVEVGGKM
jgi:hypothetical protein